ncbi:DUF2767 domain-containing protein [Dryocola clanedunensis]|uniref:DUF2767 domain-containing protein n=1 Tax=Cedecea sulfonylureivorans TaxID=3051154 RepID=UPI001926A5AB|nr:DUF2767 domain-containing protein [Cedecea sulfonylureivorans]
MKGAENDYALFEDVRRVIGRAVVVLKKSNQDVNNNTVGLILQEYAGENSNLYLNRIYTLARDIMK